MSDRLSATFRVGQRYRCTLILALSGQTGMAAEIQTCWEPGPPKQLTTAEMRDYRRGRDALLAEAARHIGGRVAVVEL